jgi:uncharacterized protein HemX
MRQAAIALLCAVLLVAAVREYYEWKQRAIAVHMELQAVVKQTKALLTSGKELVESWKRRRLFGEDEK